MNRRAKDARSRARTVDLLEVIVGWGFDDVEDGDDLDDARRRVTTDCRLMHRDGRRTFSLTQESEKNFSNLSSRSVRRQKRVCSNGRTFLIATSLLEGLWSAATTVPYAPSPRPWRIL